MSIVINIFKSLDLPETETYQDINGELRYKKNDTKVNELYNEEN